MKNKKASLSIYITFMFVAIIIVMIASVFAPMGVLFNTEMYIAGEDIIEQANESISTITDDTVRNSYYDMISSSRNAVDNNVEINSDIFQYSWVFIIILSMIVVFLYTRRLSEINRGFI